MPELHRDIQEENNDLLSTPEEDRFSCPKEARKKAMDFLARREYGQTELIKKLADKGYSRDAAEAAILTLTAEGLQSDRRFAESFVQSRVNQGKGPLRIRLDLGQRGVGDAIIEHALESGMRKAAELNLQHGFGKIRITFAERPAEEIRRQEKADDLLAPINKNFCELDHTREHRGEKIGFFFA